MAKRRKVARPARSIAKSIQNQAQHVLTTGSRFSSFDQLRQRHFWSSYYFAADANGYLQPGKFPVFTIPTGQNGQGFPSGVTLTDRETNWKSQNRVPDNQNFEITEIGVSLGIVTTDILASGTIAANPVARALDSRTFYQFLHNTVVSITYLTNSVPLGLCADFAQASAPHMGSFNSVDADTTIYRSNGLPAPALRRRFKIPILLQHGETFAFSYEVPRACFIGTQATVGAIIARLDFWATESFVEKS